MRYCHYPLNFNHPHFNIVSYEKNQKNQLLEMTECNGAKFLPHNSISLTFWAIFFTENIRYPFNIFPVIGTWGTKYLKFQIKYYIEQVSSSVYWVRFNYCLRFFSVFNVNIHLFILPASLLNLYMVIQTELNEECQKSLIYFRILMLCRRKHAKQTKTQTDTGPFTAISLPSRGAIMYSVHQADKLGDVIARQNVT